MDAIKCVNDKLREDDSTDPMMIVNEEDLPQNFINKKKKNFTLDSFEFLKVLGKGTFGKVILCR